MLKRVNIAITSTPKLCFYGSELNRKPSHFASLTAIGRHWFAPLFFTLLCACVFRAPPGLPPGFYLDPNEPLSPIVESGETTVLEQENRIAIFHGFACAKTEQTVRHGFFLQVEQVHKVSKTLDSATVFLNGWQFKYLDGDHKVFGLGTAIFNIRGQDLADRENDEIKWNAVGAISDDNYDDPFLWCYRYTLLAWNKTHFNIAADHRDDYLFESSNRIWGTALQYQPASIEVKQYRPIATILPRAYGFYYDDFDDHALLQLAYNLDYNQRFTAGDRGPGGIDRVASTNYSWETKTVFKDNAAQRDYETAELVSVISGPAMGVIQPPFTIVPREDSGACIGSRDPEILPRAIEDVPFDIAIPVLTGWDLSYKCNDERIEEIGVWVDNFSYAPAQNQVSAPDGLRPAGRLVYTMRFVLHDDDDPEPPGFQHRVSILGINDSAE